MDSSPAPDPSPRHAPPEARVVVVETKSEEGDSSDEWNLLSRSWQEHPTGHAESMSVAQEVRRIQTRRRSETTRYARRLESRGLREHADAARNAAARQPIIEGTQQLDPWKYAYSDGWALPPMVEPLLATRAALASDALTVCIETMGRGVGGHGYELEPLVGQAAIEQLDDDTRTEIMKERLEIERWFTHANPRLPFVEIYRRTVEMLETTAYAGWELVPTEDGAPVGIEPIPSYSLRIAPKPEQVLTPVPRRMADGAWGYQLQWIRSHLLVQHIYGQFRWFKFLGDPRFIDGSCGRVVGNEWIARRTLDEARASSVRRAQVLVELRALADDDGAEEAIRQSAIDQVAAIETEAMRAASDPQVAEAEVLISECERIRAEGNEAHEVMFFAHHGVSGGLSLYGTTRWLGATYAAIGRQKQQVVGMSFWDNNAVPRVAVLVAGALLGKPAVDRIKDYFGNIRGVDHQHDVLVIEAAPYSPDNLAAAMGEDRGQIKLDIKPLAQALPTEAAYRETARDWLNDVRRSFGLPPILTGDSDDYTRAVADTARLIAEEQVFAPERVLFDHAINHLLFPRLGFRHWRFKTSGAHISDETAVVALLQLAHDAAAMTSEEIRAYISQRLGWKLPAIGTEQARRPSLYNAALASYGPNHDATDPWTEQVPDPAAPGNAIVSPSSPDDEPSEVAEPGATADASVEADQASAAENESDDTASPTGRSDLRRIIRVSGVDPAALETAEGLLRLRGAIEEAMRLKQEAA